MANHYSGKRAAGRKPVGKRALSLLMALVMSLSLVQITAFAVETDQSKQVTNPGDTVYYKADGTEGSENDWAVKLSRTLTETSTENLFNVDLEVTTKDNTVSADAEAAAVLVIDTSGSMGYCTVCGEEGREEGKDHGATGYQWVYECDSKPGSYWADADGNDVCDNCGKEAYEWDWFWGWVSTHTEKRIPVGAHPFQSRLTAAKKAAKDFLDDYAKNASGSTSTKPRYVAVVEYAKDAYTRVAMVDVTKQTDREAAKGTIDRFVAGGGTNTEAGLQLASNLLAGRKTENKFVVLLTDGEPTYAIGERGDRTSTVGPIPGRSYIGNGKATSSKVNGPVETISTQLKTAGVHVFGVVYGLTKEDGTMETVPNSKGDAVAIDTWMKNDCQMEGVFKANSIDALNTAFKAIINTIQHETVGTTVVTAVNNEVGEGALTDLYNFVKFNGDANGAAANNNQVTWDLSKATPEASTANNEKTYHLSYQVWMGTETQGFEEETPYSLGAATLSFRVNDGESKSVAFPYVAAKGYLGKLNFTKVERVDNEFAPLASAEFKLTIAEGSTFGHTRPLEGTSNDKGAVAISNIPSGYTYTLSETKAPEGYVKTDKTWTVTVSYGEVTVTEAANPNDPTTGDAIENLVIENTKIPPEKVTITVIHNYYTDAVAGTPDSTETLSVEVEKGSDYTAAKQEKGEYKFVSADPEDCTLRNITAEGTITLNYVKESEQPPVDPEKVTITVIHNYYTDAVAGTPDSTETLTAEVEKGSDYTAAKQEKGEYKFVSADPEDYTLRNITAEGTITLNYVKESEQPPVNPEKVTITVIHNYYTDAVAGTPDSTETLNVEVEKGSDYTADKQEKGEYKFVSADPEDCTLRNITEAGTITLNYVKKSEQPPVETEFTATVKYYYSDNGIDGTYTYDATKDATITVKAVALPVTVTITDKADGYTFNGNYTTDGQAVSNLTVQLTENGQEFHVYYYKNASTPTPPPAPSYTYYTVTVNYYDKDSGEVIHTAYTTTQREYTAYDVTAQDKIAITGYTYVETTGDALTGTLNGNKVINVYYTKDNDIDDGNTPTDPGTDIGDDDVPVTPAKPPKTGDSMGLWIAVAMVSGMGLIWLSLSGKKRKEEI